MTMYIDQLKDQLKSALAKQIQEKLAIAVRNLIPNASFVYFRPGVEYCGGKDEYFLSSLNVYDKNGNSLLGINRDDWSIEDGADYNLMQKVLDACYRAIDENDFCFVYGSAGAEVFFDEEVTLSSDEEKLTGQEQFRQELTEKIKEMVRRYYPDVVWVHINYALDYVDGHVTANASIQLVNHDRSIVMDSILGTGNYPILLAEFKRTISVLEFYFAFNGRVADIELK